MKAESILLVRKKHKVKNSFSFHNSVPNECIFPKSLVFSKFRMFVLSINKPFKFQASSYSIPNENIWKNDWKRRTKK